MNPTARARSRRLRLDALEAEWDLEEADRALERRQREALRFPSTDRERETVRRAERGVRAGRTEGRRSVAFHESGHVVMAWTEGRTPRGAVIFEDGAGHAWIARGEEWPTTADLAGAVASRLAGFTGSGPSESDREGARQSMARAGMGGRAADDWLTRAEDVAKRELRARWGAVEGVADHLLRRGWIDGETAIEIIADTGAVRA